jgi:hypothetical protein
MFLNTVHYIQEEAISKSLCENIMKLLIKED